MNPKLKLAAYAVMVILCVWFGAAFYSNYSAVTKAAAADNSAPPPDTTAATPANAPSTNADASAGTNAASTNLAVAPSDTNAPASTNVAAPVTTAAPPQTAQKTAATPVDLSKRRTAMMTYLAAFVGAIIGLGLLIAVDVTQFMGTQAIDFLFNDAGTGQRDPEYEKAEFEWAQGRHLDAIQMMRDYLKKHPREMYVALRIAEIYEKDLRNYVAATLEYEEILKHKLPAERWGWSAVHLCNLYTKANKQDKALQLLKRVADEYPKTGAAKKARARLGIPEPVEAEEEGPADEDETQTADGHTIIVMEERPPELEPRGEGSAETSSEERPPSRSSSPSGSDPSKPHLPPGFRPKK